MPTDRRTEDRLRAMEDRLEIHNLIAGHPPSADTGAVGFARTAYADDGALDLPAGKGARGNAAVAAILSTPEHQAAIAGGLAHFASLPHVEIDGDQAVVTSYLQILTPDPSAAPVELAGHGTSTGFRIHRVGANRWEMARTADRRVLRPLDGSEPARDILRGAIDAFMRQQA